MAIRSRLAASLMGVASLWTGPVSAQTVESMRVQGTELRVRLSDGSVRGSRDLVGATLEIESADGPLEIRIDAVEPDPKAPGVLLHHFSRRMPDGSFAAFCEPDADGRRAGFPIAGRATPDGRIVPAEGRFELTCTSGAQGKCVRFGYRPDRDADLYAACIRMVRADYCGDGTAATRDGTVIDVYDDAGIQRADRDPSHAFEAGWSAEGAVCVHHPRVPENGDLRAIEAHCPRLAGRTGAACDDATARSLGARVFDRSLDPTTPQEPITPAPR